ncbi:hypothetical protein PENSPDRAFT_632664 [Peniophora sp. CONT]|nr:hypothetical protein PENSPDRAFT_632664 [Peniophora sp. CONT]
MSALLATLRGPSQPLRVAQTSVRTYARKEVSTAGDPTKENLRKTLYPPNIRSKAAPTGTWRPDVARALQVAVPSRQAHETIERAWKLHVRHTRKRREAELARKFECMREAMDELQRIDPRRYREANRVVDPRDRAQGEEEWLKTLSVAQRRAFESRLPGLFPRELRVPTHTPPRDGWNYDFKPVMPRQPKQGSS